MSEHGERSTANQGAALGAGREFDAIRALLARWGALAQGIGDDAALLDVPAGHRLVVSTDVSVEHVHFRGEWLTPRQVGYRATAAALSDLAAMGARPLGVLSALTVPREWREHLEDLGEGIADAAAIAGCPIVGGDLSGGAHLALAITVLGSVRDVLRRDGARPGDLVYVTGRLGGAGSALRSLMSGDAVLPDALERFARPVPRLAEARWLLRRGATSAVDVSDGLAADLGHVAAASRARITIDLERVPVFTGVTPIAAVASGEEYEIAVSASAPLDTQDFERCFGLPLTEVGRVESVAEAGEVVLIERGARVDLPRGHDHFTR
jgi:thiamine-monophosphate kinase